MIRNSRVNQSSRCGTGRLLGRRLVPPLAAPAESRDGQVPQPRDGQTAGTVLVTGGTGMLGSLVAGHLAGTGRARVLMLASRSGPAAPGAADLAAGLARAGAAVQLAVCDAGDREAVAGVLARVPGDAPLTGIVHAAGVLDDGVTGLLTPGRVEAVMRPKADAAWHLHELTAQEWTGNFVLFSSAAAVFGSRGRRITRPPMRFWMAWPLTAGRRGGPRCRWRGGRGRMTAA